MAFIFVIMLRILILIISIGGLSCSLKPNTIDGQKTTYRIVIQPSLEEEYLQALKELSPEDKQLKFQLEAIEMNGLAILIDDILDTLEIIDLKDSIIIESQRDTLPWNFNASSLHHVFNRIINDTILIHIGDVFQDVKIKHKIIRRQYLSEVRLTNPDLQRIYTLGKNDDLRWSIELPVVVQEFKLNKRKYKRGDKYYGFAEITAGPYYDLSNGREKLKIRCKFKYYFSGTL